jgi:hypothetical protein
VNRLQKSLLLVFGIAIPAAAHSAFAPKAGTCFASGTATYRIAPEASEPDFRIRVGGDVQHPDLRMRLVDSAVSADFVLVDDFGAISAGACRSATPVLTVKADAQAARPDVTVKLLAGDGPADYTIYVHSMRYSQQDAAALLAAMWKSERRRELAARNVR